MQEKEYIRLFSFKVTLCDTSRCNSVIAYYSSCTSQDICGKSHLHSCMCLDIEGGCKVERHGGAKVKVTEDVS